MEIIPETDENFVSGYADDHVLTLSMPHATIVVISHLVEKVPLQELLHATKFSMRLV